MRRVFATLWTETGPQEVRKRSFSALQGACRRKQSDPSSEHMAKVMASFKPGLFVGQEIIGLPDDNLGLERFFKLPKQHQRHIHGRAHAGVRLVHSGPTLMLVLDAHVDRSETFTADELRPYLGRPLPPEQRAAMERHKVMRTARSSKKRPGLLAALEARYLAG